MKIKKSISVENKVCELKEIVLGNVELEPLTNIGEESLGEKVYNLLQEAGLIYGDDYAEELVSKLRVELQKIDKASNAEVGDALSAITEFTKDKGYTL